MEWGKVIEIQRKIHFGMIMNIFQKVELHKKIWNMVNQITKAWIHIYAKKIYKKHKMHKIQINLKIKKKY